MEWFVTPNRPQKGLKLFEASGNREKDAIIGDDDCFGWDAYCFGYKRAADVLVDRFLEKRNDFSAYYESQAYAIIFLYRHYLELRLKELLIAYGRLFGEPVKVASHRHYLARVWKEIRNMENRTRTEPVPEIDEDLEVLEGIIKEFDKIDPKSEVFRYPTSSDGKAVSLPVIQVGLQVLKQRMHWVSYILDGWSVGVDEYIKVGRESAF
ncbi:MAG: hypothetical protein Q7T05_07615 [Dehalococcoidia bacterium]|nr:hypothetical protein [Dehalococcoidia bacterium]